MRFISIFLILLNFSANALPYSVERKYFLLNTSQISNINQMLEEILFQNTMLTSASPKKFSANMLQDAHEELNNVKAIDDDLQKIFDLQKNTKSKSIILLCYHAHLLANIEILDSPEFKFLSFESINNDEKILDLLELTIANCKLHDLALQEKFHSFQSTLLENALQNRTEKNFDKVQALWLENYIRNLIIKEIEKIELQEESLDQEQREFEEIFSINIQNFDQQLNVAKADIVKILAVYDLYTAYIGSAFEKYDQNSPLEIHTPFNLSRTLKRYTKNYALKAILLFSLSLVLMILIFGKKNTKFISEPTADKFNSFAHNLSTSEMAVYFYDSAKKTYPNLTFSTFASFCVSDLSMNFTLEIAKEIVAKLQEISATINSTLPKLNTSSWGDNRSSSQTHTFLAQDLSLVDYAISVLNSSAKDIQKMAQSAQTAIDLAYSLQLHHGMIMQNALNAYFASIFTNTSFFNSSFANKTQSQSRSLNASRTVSGVSAVFDANLTSSFSSSHSATPSKFASFSHSQSASEKLSSITQSQTPRPTPTKIPSKSSSMSLSEIHNTEKTQTANLKTQSHSLSSNLTDSETKAFNTVSHIFALSKSQSDTRSIFSKSKSNSLSISTSFASALKSPSNLNIFSKSDSASFSTSASTSAVLSTSTSASFSTSASAALSTSTDFSNSKSFNSHSFNSYSVSASISKSFTFSKSVSDSLSDSLSAKSLEPTFIFGSNSYSISALASESRSISSDPSDSVSNSKIITKSDSQTKSVSSSSFTKSLSADSYSISASLSLSHSYSNSISDHSSLSRSLLVSKTLSRTTSNSISKSDSKHLSLSKSISNLLSNSVAELASASLNFSSISHSFSLDFSKTLTSTNSHTLEFSITLPLSHSATPSKFASFSHSQSASEKLSSITQSQTQKSKTPPPTPTKIPSKSSSISLSEINTLSKSISQSISDPFSLSFSTSISKSLRAYKIVCGNQLCLADMCLDSLQICCVDKSSANTFVDFINYSYSQQNQRCCPENTTLASFDALYSDSFSFSINPCAPAKGNFNAFTTSTDNVISYQSSVVCNANNVFYTFSPLITTTNQILQSSMCCAPNSAMNLALFASSPNVRSAVCCPSGNSFISTYLSYTTLPTPNIYIGTCCPTGTIFYKFKNYKPVATGAGFGVCCPSGLFFSFNGFKDYDLGIVVDSGICSQSNTYTNTLSAISNSKIIAVASANYPNSMQFFSFPVINSILLGSVLRSGITASSIKNYNYFKAYENPNVTFYSAINCPDSATLSSSELIAQLLTNSSYSHGTCVENSLQSVLGPVFKNTSFMINSHFTCPNNSTTRAFLFWLQNNISQFHSFQCAQQNSNSFVVQITSDFNSSVASAINCGNDTYAQFITLPNQTQTAVCAQNLTTSTLLNNSHNLQSFQLLFNYPSEYSTVKTTTNSENGISIIIAFQNSFKSILLNVSNLGRALQSAIVCSDNASFVSNGCSAGGVAGELAQNCRTFSAVQDSAQNSIQSGTVCCENSQTINTFQTYNDSQLTVYSSMCCPSDSVFEIIPSLISNSFQSHSAICRPNYLQLTNFALTNIDDLSIMAHLFHDLSTKVQNATLFQPNQFQSINTAIMLPNSSHLLAYKLHDQLELFAFIIADNNLQLQSLPVATIDNQTIYSATIAPANFTLHSYQNYQNTIRSISIFSMLMCPVTDTFRLFKILELIDSSSSSNFGNSSSLLSAICSTTELENYLTYQNNQTNLFSSILHDATDSITIFKNYNNATSNEAMFSILLTPLTIPVSQFNFYTSSSGLNFELISFIFCPTNTHFSNFKIYEDIYNNSGFGALCVSDNSQFNQYKTYSGTITPFLTNTTLYSSLYCSTNAAFHHFRTAEYENSSTYAALCCDSNTIFHEFSTFVDNYSSLFSSICCAVDTYLNLHTTVKNSNSTTYSATCCPNSSDVVVSSINTGLLCCPSNTTFYSYANKHFNDTFLFDSICCPINTACYRFLFRTVDAVQEFNAQCLNSTNDPLMILC